jgi:hypothetical protein
MHKNFSSMDGDMPMLVSVYESWLKSGKSKDWSRANYVNSRALTHAFEVRKQLSVLLEKLGFDVGVSCRPERDPFLK